MKYFVLLLLLSSSITGSGQDTTTIERVISPEQRAIKRTLIFSNHLDLSNEESQQVMPVFLAFFQQRKTIFNQTKSETETAMLQQQLVTLNTETEQALSRALSPEKNRKWQYLKTKKKVKKWLAPIRRNKMAWIAGGIMVLLLVFFAKKMR